jgi:hypothetical protein
MNAVTKAALPVDNALLVLVGDKKLILEQLKGLQLPTPTEYTVTGEPAAQ